MKTPYLLRSNTPTHLHRLTVGMRRRTQTSALYLLCIAPFFLVFSTLSLPLPFNDDVLGLIVFKAEVEDPSAALSSWCEDDPSPCNWTGIQCSPGSGRVVGVTLDGMSLSGRIGKGLSRLDQLRTLSLSRNNFSGAIDPSLSALSLLKTLNLSSNSFSGSIPPELGNITSLHVLDISHNIQSGSIPQELLWPCQGLQILSLADNLLEGMIPASVGNCHQLLSLDVSQNRLTGQIPDTLGGLTVLRQLDLSENNISGPIPPNVGALGSLVSLKAHDNAVTGSIPPQLGDCSSLRVLDLSNNFLGGVIPPSLQTLQWLSILRLRHNALSGAIPAAIARLGRLQELQLAHNGFTGQIPDSLGSLGLLHTLSLAQNNLEGTIPGTLSMCSKVAILDLSGNNLTGTIFPQLFSLPQLRWINLSMNSFRTELPSLSPTDCGGLQALDLSHGDFSGPLPARLSQCSALRFLDLSHNRISGGIPTDFKIGSLLSYLDLSNNQLEGYIPDVFSSCSSLSRLDFADNVLQGPIPDTLFKCAALTELNLSLNFLDGMLPMELGNLRSLQRLNLSYNNFTGPIPQSIVQLKYISSLDVSHNALEGQIPMAGFLTTCNSCSFEGNAGLCGSPVGIVCPLIPKPIVLNPNDTGVPNPIMSSSGRSRKNVLTVSTIAAISAAVFITIGVGTVTLLNLRTRAAIPHEKSDLFVTDSLPASQSEELSAGKLVMFTDGMEPRPDEMLPSASVLLNKNCEIGRGGYGVVYKAVFTDGRTVAVKKLMVAGLVQSQKDFQREVHLLGKVIHPHLVSLRGYCWTSKLPFLVYDYISNGSLYQRLHERTSTEAPLTWSERFKIALGTASALSYLHHECHPPMEHFALKSTNILLDEECSPHLSDYGLAKLFPMIDRYVLSNRFHTAQGYMAPECAYKNLKINEKCDVYGYGVILLELVTGRRPIQFVEDDVVILSDLVRSFMDDGKPLECVDPSLGSYSEDEVVPVIRLGLICISHMPSNRPSMTEVVQILELIKPLEDVKESL